MNNDAQEPVSPPKKKCCCSSGQIILKSAAVVLCLGTFCLSGYSHFSSPYTKANHFPNYTHFFTEQQANNDDKDVAIMVAQLPSRVGNGYESCRAFKHFLKQLGEELREKYGVRTSLIDSLASLIRCPRLLNERVFVGVAALCGFISLLVLAINLCCAVTNNWEQVLSKRTDAGFYLLCAIVMLGGLVMMSLFLKRTSLSCNATPLLKQHVLEALEAYQQHSNHKPPVVNRETVEMLMPLFYRLPSTTPGEEKHSSRKRRSVPENGRQSKFGVTSFSWSIHHSERRNKRGVEVTIKDDQKGRVIGRSMFASRSEEDNVVTAAPVVSQEEHKGSCKLHVKYYWKVMAAIACAVTIVTYISAAVSVLVRKNPEDLILVMESSNSKSKAASKSPSKTPMDMNKQSNEKKIQK